jgi:hypothetical protein
VAVRSARIGGRGGANFAPLLLAKLGLLTG